MKSWKVRLTVLLAMLTLLLTAASPAMAQDRRVLYEEFLDAATSHCLLLLSENVISANGYAECVQENFAEQVQAAGQAGLLE